MRSSSALGGRVGRLLMVLLVALAAARVVGGLWAVTAGDERLPQWDPAKYGAAGVRLADAVRGGDVGEFLRQVNRLSLWPPLYPVVGELPVFLVAGGGYRVADGVAGACVLLAALAAWACGRAVSGPPRNGIAAALAGGVTAALVLVSPAVHLFGTLSMLEAPGALLTLVALWAYARSLVSGRRGDWRGACAAATGLFFLKYNYGLLWLAPLGLTELWIAAGEEGVGKRIRRWVRGRWAAVDFGRVWTWFVVGYLVLLGALEVTGGWDLEVGGRRFGIHGLGNPVYVLVLLVVARCGLVPGRRREVVAWYRGLGDRGRIALGWIGVPIATWLLVPPHLKDFLQFVENRSSDLPPWNLAGLGFYPRAFVTEYSPHPAVGVAVLVLAAVPFAHFGRLSPARCALALTLAVGAAALLLHPYKLERFSFTLAPLLWLSAAGAAVDGIEALGGWLARRREGRAEGEGKSGKPGEGAAPAVRSRRAALPAYVAVAAVAVWLAGIALPAAEVVDRDRLTAARAARTVPATVRPLLDELADVAARSEWSVLVGAWNNLSPALVEWHLRLRHPDIAPSRVPLDAARLASADHPSALLDRVSRSARKRNRTERLLLLDPLDGGPESAETLYAETAWLAPLRTALPTDPRFTLESDHPFPAAGYRLRVFRTAP